MEECHHSSPLDNMYNPSHRTTTSMKEEKDQHSLTPLVDLEEAYKAEVEASVEETSAAEEALATMMASATMTASAEEEATAEED